MFKKILFYISLVIGLALLFLFGKGNNINILAISSFDNNIGTLPIQIDIDNYNTKNIFILGNMELTNNGNLSYSYENQILTLNGSVSSGSVQLGQKLPQSILLEGNYTFSVYFEGSYVSGGERLFISLVDSSNEQVFYCHPYSYEKKCSLTETNLNLIVTELKIWAHEGDVFNNFKIKIQLEKGLNSSDYVKPFKFGYILSGDIQLLCPNESVTHNISLLIFNNENLLYKSNYFNGSSCGYIRFDNVYLPFNINNKGNVSFNLNLRFMVDGWGAGLYTLDYGSKLVLTPIYEAYYKGNPANDNIYTKLSYTSNSIYYNGYNLEYSDGSTNLFYFLGNKNILGYNLSIEEAKFNKNVTSDYSIEINNYNKFSFNNFLNFPLEIYLFSGNEDTTLMSMSSTNIYVSFSSISSRVSNNQSTTTPLPDNELTNDKYNSCSAWYDIPCQLGNAITYVIYEAPIVSPVLNFIVSFITMFSSLISFFDKFRAFGIVFGCFVIYIFIELLDRYSQ